MLKNKKDLGKAKAVAGKDALNKLEMNSAEIRSVFNEKEEIVPLPSTEFLCSGMGNEAMTEMRFGESHTGDCDDDNVIEQVEETKRAEHDNSFVAGSEGIGTVINVLLKMESRTNGTEDGQSKDFNNIACDAPEERDPATTLSFPSYTDDNVSCGYIKDSGDEETAVPLNTESNLSNNTSIPINALMSDDYEIKEEGDCDDAPTYSYTDTVTAKNAHESNRDTPSVTDQKTRNENSPRKEYDLDDARRAAKKRRYMKPMRSKSEQILGMRTSISTGQSKKPSAAISSPETPDVGRKRRKSGIVVKNIEAYSRSKAISNSTRIVESSYHKAHIAQRRSKGNVTPQDTPRRRITTHTSKHLADIYSKEKTYRIREGTGKKEDRFCPKGGGNDSVRTARRKDTGEEKVTEQCKMKESTATANKNFKPLKKVYGGTSTDSSLQSPVIGNLTEKSPQKSMPPSSTPTKSSPKKKSMGTATTRGKKPTMEDLYDFEDSEEDDPRSFQKPKQTLLPPVPTKLPEMSLSHAKKTKLFQRKEQARVEKPVRRHGRTVDNSQSDMDTSGDDEATVSSAPYSTKSLETIRDMASEFNILVRQMKRFAKRFNNFCKEDIGDGESQFEIVGLEDDDLEEIEVAPGWSLPREVVVKAGLSNTMSNRLGILMRNLWDAKTRNVLSTKKDGKGDVGRKRVTTEEATLLKDACYNLQRYKKLPLNEVRTVEDTMQAIGKKLSYARYNVIRQEKQAVKMQNRGKAVLDDKVNTHGDSDANTSDENEYGDGEEVDSDDDSVRY